jgi:hypothetical protein
MTFSCNVDWSSTISHSASLPFFFFFFWYEYTQTKFSFSQRGFTLSPWGEFFESKKEVYTKKEQQKLIRENVIQWDTQLPVNWRGSVKLRAWHSLVFPNLGFPPCLICAGTETLAKFYRLFVSFWPVEFLCLGVGASCLCRNSQCGLADEIKQI